MNGTAQQKYRLSPSKQAAQKIRAVCLLGLAILLTLLTSCGLLAQQPPSQAVRLAVAQQLSSAQQNIAQSLGRSDTQATEPMEPNFKIDSLDITSREKVSEARFQRKGYPTDIYKVRGTVETTLTASNRNVQQTSPFEIYLGISAPQKTSKTTKNSSGTGLESTENSVETWYLIAPDVPKRPQ